MPGLEANPAVRPAAEVQPVPLPDRAHDDREAFEADIVRPGAEGAFSLVNDALTGERSSSRVGIEGEARVFSGTLRLDCGGGFASMRTNLPSTDLRALSGIELVVGGDGRPYGLLLRDEVRAGRVRHPAAFEMPAGDIRTLRLPFSSFEPPCARIPWSPRQRPAASSVCTDGSTSSSAAK